MPLDLPAHVWVTDGMGKRPGLLIYWRRHKGVWQGWVVVAHSYVSSARGAADVDHQVQLWQSWVDAKTIEPR